MPGKIPKYFINDLLSRTNIIELINARITLKKQGKNYKTNCPFHHDKTPSFTVSYEKQFYYCFGCNAHGNAIDFLINYDHLNFIESIEELAITNGLTIPFQNKIKNEYFQKEKIYSLMKKISKLYQKNTLLTDSSKKYIKNRGINQEMIDFFSIGFIDKNWNDFSKKFNISEKFQQELIKNEILSITPKGYIYNRFYERIIFPIHNKHGNIIGFGGRALHNITPKYINSPETDIFHKGKEIYGLYQVKKKCLKPEYLLVVEGYIDVITLTQYNINYVVSLLGTATTKEQIKILFCTTNIIIYCYDGDLAGINAAWRALKIALPYISETKILKFILLPNNEDPDTIIRKEGYNHFNNRIKNAMTMSQFFFQNILKNVNLYSIDDKFYFSKYALPLIDKITNDTVRIYFRQILARKIGILDDNQFNKFLYETENTKKQDYQFKIKRTPMRVLIGLLIQNPSLAQIVPKKLNFNNIKIKGLPIFLEILKTCIKFPNLNTGQLLELYRDQKIINIFKMLAKWDHMIAPKEIKTMFLDLLININNKILQKRQEYLISQERITGLTINEKKEVWSINQSLSKKTQYD
ncbi:DNA primase [Buchnera aphidicola]|uniref:DNA primase n=1 Tax=Buchnera aphidicola TaxID=9 RepID=UPI003BEEC16F